MDETEIHCPTCMALLPKELQRELYSGKSVTCENCGTLLVPRVQGQAGTSGNMVKQEARVTSQPVVTRTPQQASSSPGVSKPLVSAAQQWREERERRHKERRDRLEARVESLEQRHQKHREGKEQRKAVKKNPVQKPASNDGQKRPSNEHMDRLKRHIHGFNDASLNLLKLFLGLFYIISIAGLVYYLVFNQFSLVVLVSALLRLYPFYLIGAFMYWYETRRVHPWLAQDQYEFYGIDMVLVGILGCAVCGVGVLLFIKGLMVMDYMVKQDRLDPRSRRDVLISWINGLDEVSWMFPALGAAFAFGAVASAMVNSVVLAMPDPSFITYLVLGILGIIAANSDLQSVSSRIRAWQFDGLGGKTLANAVLGCICFGTGVPLLFKAILLFQIDEYDRRVHVPVSGAGKLAQQQAPIQPVSRPELRGPVYVSMQPVPPVITATPVPAKKSPNVVQGRATARGAAPFKSANKPAGPASILSQKSPASIEVYLQRSFSVLTPRVRKRLLKLKKIGMSDDEIEGVAGELVFHPEFEQLDIIADYMDLNKDDVDPIFVLAVRKMNYDENTKKWILDQLKMIPEKDIPAFLDQMKNSQPN